MQITQIAWFSSSVMGHALLEALGAHAGGNGVLAGLLPRRLTVLCGHTHSRAEWEPSSRLAVHCGSVGETDYGAPRAAGLVHLSAAGCVVERLETR